MIARLLRRWALWILGAAVIEVGPHDVLVAHVEYGMMDERAEELRRMTGARAVIAARPGDHFSVLKCYPHRFWRADAP